MMLQLRCKTPECINCVQVYVRDTEDELARKRLELLVRSQLPARCGCGGEIAASWKFPLREAGVGL